MIHSSAYVEKSIRKQVSGYDYMSSKTKPDRDQSHEYSKPNNLISDLTSPLCIYVVAKKNSISYLQMQMQLPLRSSQTPLLRFLPCARLNPPAGRGFILQTSPRLSSLLSSTSQRQGQERDDYYSLILSSSSLKSTNPIFKPAAPGESKEKKTNKKGEHSSQQKVIFGSRLAGPAAREKEGWALERPPEPDNCCMSGCVNCVWDAYREEVEEWAAKGRAGNSSVTDARAVQGGTTDTEEFQREGLFEGVPVGIREFMALEKKLREKEASEEGKG